MPGTRTRAPREYFIDAPLRAIKSSARRDDESTVNDDLAANLDFDLDLPFGDATFFGQPSRYDAPTTTGRDTPLGQIVALSTRGVRIDHDGETDLTVGQSLTLRLVHGREQLDLPARVTQVLARGFRHYTYGLVFDDLTDPQRDRLYRFLTVDRTQLKVA